MSDPVIEIYPVPEDLRQSRISLELREADGDWISVPLAFAGSIDGRPHANGGCEAWACFSSDIQLEARVTIPEPVAHAKLRPSMQEPVSCKVSSRMVEFRLDSPRYLALEINHRPVPGDYRWSGAYTVYLLMDPIDRNVPRQGDAGVRVLLPGHHQASDFDPDSEHCIFLLPGVHTVEGQMIDLHSEKTLYLSGGAYLRSYIRGENVNGASIRGRGVIDGTGVERKSIEWRDDGDAGFVFFRRGSGNVIDGPVIFDSPFWNIVTFGTKDMLIRNHKCIAWKVNNDGIQPRSCNGMRVERCFLKCADDCIAVKTRRSAGMTSRDLIFRDLVCWNDIPGNAVEIGHTSQADILENVTFENISVIHAAGDESDSSFTISVSLIDHSHVRNILYKDFFVEGLRNGDFRFWIGVSRYTTDEERGRISDIHVYGYHLEGEMTHSLFSGADLEHCVSDINLENITCENGQKATKNQLGFKMANSRNVHFNGECIS